jgi:hypothetical protein
MPPRVRKFLLTVHVASSVGWLGAVGVFLALAIAGLTADDAQVVRAAYLAMDSIGWFVLVPLSLASLVTGLVQALAGKWGLFRHYWVIVKLGINLVATVVLLLYMQTLSYLAGLAAEPTLSDGLSPVLHAGAALLLLLVATTLSIYKPAGMTRYGQRKHRQRPGPRAP